MRLRPLFKPVINRVLPPLTKYYLRKTRKYSKDGLQLLVHPGVFHPGLYLSTQFMRDHLASLDLTGKDCLELGAGSGFLSLCCAKRGAVVTASDINPLAIANIRENAAANGVDLSVVESDLFTALKGARFDLILINPPYYPGTPQNEGEHAWYCGPEFEYFQRLFADLGDHLKAGATVLMVLSEDCALQRIAGIGADAGWKMEEVARRQRWAEWNYIYALKAVNEEDELTLPGLRA